MRWPARAKAFLPRAALRDRALPVGRSAQDGIRSINLSVIAFCSCRIARRRSLPPGVKTSTRSARNAAAGGGARFVIENAKPFGRGLRGVSYVFVTKDRPGQLRAHGKPTKLPGKTFFGTLIVDADLGSSADFRLGLYAPSDDDDTAATAGGSDLAELIHDTLAEQPGGAVAASRTLFALLRQAGHAYRDTAVRNALDDLLVAGRVVEVPGKRGARGYRAVPETGDNGPETAE